LFAAPDDSLILNPPAEEHVRKLLIKTESMLQYLSAKMVDRDESSYRYVLAWTEWTDLLHSASRALNEGGLANWLIGQYAYSQ